MAEPETRALLEPDPALGTATATVGRLLVTGATGFIGSWIVRTALALDCPVRGLVRSHAKAHSLEIETAELHTGDLADPESLIGVMEGVDVVVHCAARLGKWGTTPEELERTNVEGTRTMLDLASDYGARFFHLSTCGVSGDVGSDPADETFEPNPATGYERAKLAAERLVLERAAAGAWACVLRPTWTYGPGDPHKLPLFRAIQKGRYAFVSGGKALVHPVFVSDLVAGVFRAIERARSGEVYLLGGATPHTQKQLAHAIADALGVRRTWISLPRPVFQLAALPFELAGRLFGFEPMLTRGRVTLMASNYGYSIDKAREQLGYAPAVDLKEGLRIAVQDYRDRRVLA